MDALPSSALASAAFSGTGSVWGYDDLVPLSPSVVSERRLYPKADRDVLAVGQRRARAILNALKVELATELYDELHVQCDRLDGGGGVITVSRFARTTGNMIVFICRPAFRRESPTTEAGVPLPTIRIPGRLIGVAMAGTLHVDAPAAVVRAGEAPVGTWAPASTFVEDAHCVTGLPCRLDLSVGDLGGLGEMYTDADHGSVELRLYPDKFLCVPLLSVERYVSHARTSQARECCRIACVLRRQLPYRRSRRRVPPYRERNAY